MRSSDWISMNMNFFLFYSSQFPHQIKKKIIEIGLVDHEIMYTDPDDIV